jgi:hypothetical protein
MHDVIESVNVQSMCESGSVYLEGYKSASGSWLGSTSSSIDTHFTVACLALPALGQLSRALQNPYPKTQKKDRCLPSLHRAAHSSDADILAAGARCPVFLFNKEAANSRTGRTMTSMKVKAGCLIASW